MRVLQPVVGWKTLEKSAAQAESTGDVKQALIDLLNER